VKPLTILALLLALAVAQPALAHEGHQHGPPPKPKTPVERLLGTFTGEVPDKPPAAKPIRITREVTGGGGGRRLLVATSYTPSHLFMGRSEPVRWQITDNATGEPLSGYAPKLTYKFPSGAVARGTMVEVVGHPGLYEYWPVWKEPGPVEFSFRIGQGDQAPLPNHSETIYAKRPSVPLGSYLIAGFLVTLALGGMGVTFIKGASRIVALVIAAAVGFTAPLLIRAPIAARAEAIHAAEARMLARLQVERDVPWPDRLGTLERPALAVDTRRQVPVTAPVESGTPPLPPPITPSANPVLGTLVIPDDARAVLSSHHAGAFTAERILARGTRVRKGQSLGAVRVHNDEIAPEAATAPGDVAEARAAVTAAESHVAQARRDLERGRRLYGGEAISRRELEAREQALELAEADLRAARGRLDAAQDRVHVLKGLGGTSVYRSFPITSPIDGVITEVGVAAGQSVTEGEMIYTVVDPSRLWLEAHLFEDQVRGLQPGATRTFVTATDPTPRTAVLWTLGLAFDPDSSTLPAIFEVQPPLAGLFAGQTVTLQPEAEGGDA